MILNYIKISFRNLEKRWPYTLVNLFGLSLGLSCFIILFTYTGFEESYEDFYKNKENIYRINMERHQNGELMSIYPNLPPAFGNVVKSEIPEVKHVTRFYNEWSSDNIIKYQDLIFNEKELCYADEDFFSMFSIELLRGNPKSCLSDLYSMVISQKMAVKYFGDKDPIGEQLELGNQFGKNKFTITGIVKELPKNTVIKFDFLCSFNSIHNGRDWFYNSWKWWGFPTYVSFKKGYEISNTKQDFKRIIKKYKKKDNDSNVDWVYTPQLLEKIHLHSNFRNDNQNLDKEANKINILKIIVLLIIVISWINYINLSTASAAERAKETGIRKALGATKQKIISQFLVEASITNILSLIVAVIVVSLTFNAFFNFLNLDIDNELLLKPRLWIYVFFMLIIGVIASGLYPAIVLSSFKPIDVLKTKTSTSPANTLVRKLLIGFQFTVSIILISGILIVIHQNKFLQNKDKGIDIKNVIVVAKPELIKNHVYRNKFPSFVKEIKQLNGVVNSSANYAAPTYMSWDMAIWRKDKGIETQESQFIIGADENYLNTYSLKLITGRNIDDNRASDNNALVISKNTSQRLGFNFPEEALGKKIGLEFPADKTFEIIGVIEDFHHYTTKTKPNGFILLKNIHSFKHPKCISIKIKNENQLEEVLNDVKILYDKFFPGNLFEYEILEDRYKSMFKDEIRNQNIFSIFSSIAILLACIGVIGLASFIAFLKTKEIGIRKLFGASMKSIIWVLCNEFIFVILISTCIAIPLILFFMGNWLEEYPYRISIQFWHLFISVFFVCFITFIIIIFNLIRVMKREPIKILQS